MKSFGLAVLSVVICAVVLGDEVVSPEIASATPASGGPVDFCGKTWPLHTRVVRCYEGRGMGKGKPMDLRPLAHLTQLESLYLVSGELEFILQLALKDLQPLAKLHKLRTLHLGHTTVSDIAPLRNLVALEDLSLHASPVQDINPLANLHKLRALDLSGTQVKDVTPLAGLTGLEQVDLSGTPVDNLQPLLQSNKLRSLGLHPKSAVPQADLVQLRAKFPGLHEWTARCY